MNTQTVNKSAMPQRRWDIDWLRVIAVVLFLVPYHTYRIFDTFETWYVKNDQLSTALNWFIIFGNAVAMQLLFLLAGAATWFALRRRSGVQYVKECLMRLLIPAYVLLAVGVMIVLTERGVLSDLLILSYVMFAIAIPFFVVYAQDPKQWWPLIPGGITAVIGLSFLVAEAAVQYVGPAVLVLVGVWILVRVFTRRGPTAPETPAPTGPEADEPPAE